MTVICWNVRGWGKEGRRADVFDLIKHEKADMCGLVETKVAESNNRFIKRSLPKEWDWIGNADSNQRHRIIVGWAKDSWRVQILLVDPQIISLQCVNTKLNKEIFFSFVYGKNRETERCLLWNLLETSGNMLNSRAAPWMVIGDFNTVRSLYEKIGGNRANMAWLDRFNSCLQNSGLVDLNTKGAHLTWTNRQQGNLRILERIDRSLVNNAWLQAFPSSWTECLSTRSSDHSPLVARWEHEVNWGPKPFKHFNFWARKEGYRESVSVAWADSDSILGTPQFIVAEIGRASCRERVCLYV